MRYSVVSLLTLALGAIAVPKADIKTYNGYKVFRVNTHGKADVKEKLAPVTFDEWEHGDQYADIVVAPNDVDAFESLKLDFTTLHENLGDSIVSESPSHKKWKRQADDESWYDEFHNYEDHIDYFRDLHAQFPNNSKLVSSGKSYQNRNIYGLHLWGEAGPGKPAVLYHGTVHAREWISAPTVEYITLQLIKGFKGGDKDVQTILNKYDFYIFPFVNPDGFVSCPHLPLSNLVSNKIRSTPPRLIVSGERTANLLLLQHQTRHVSVATSIATGSLVGIPTREVLRQTLVLRLIAARSQLIALRMLDWTSLFVS